VTGSRRLSDDNKDGARMATNSLSFKVSPEGVVPGLKEALAKLNGAQCEVVLDFSSVLRIGPKALRAMESLASAADEKASKVVLCGVNVSVYRVLKLMQLARRFSFLT
jgi:anti-anti-sigma regulatory factor